MSTIEKDADAEQDEHVGENDESEPSGSPRPPPPEADVDVALPAQSRVLRLTYWAVWFGLVPCVAIYLSFKFLMPDLGVVAEGAFGWLRSLFREQPIPMAIGLYSLFTLVVWFARHQLPLAAHAHLPIPAGVSTELRPDFERARALCEEAVHIRNKNARAYAKQTSEAQRKQLDDALRALRNAMYREPFRKKDLAEALRKADGVVTRILGRWRKGEVREIVEQLALAFGVALLLRTCLADPFKIPTGSMIPTLHVGDHIFVNKLKYGPQLPMTQRRLWETMPPARGAVAVFAYPEEPDKDFIKRIIGLPGDKIDVKNGHPWINGWEVPSCVVGDYKYWHDGTPDDPTSRWRNGTLFVEYLGEQTYFTLQTVPLDTPDTGPFYVAPREAFAMGDNRNNSKDSRFWYDNKGGGVPFANFRGPASLIWFSFPGTDIDWSRIGRFVMPSKLRLINGMDGLGPAFDKCMRERPSVTNPPAPK